MPQALVNYSPCGTQETVDRGIDFSNGLATGETLTGTATCAVSVTLGTDASSQSRLLAGPTISGTIVGVLLGTMLPSVTYQILITVGTSAGQTLSCYASQAVLSQ